jgi:hypothetical protein
MRLLTLLGFILFNACAPLALQDKGYTEPVTTVEVYNHFRCDIRVFVETDTGERRRIGYVTAYGGRAVLTIPRHMAGRSVRFWILPMGDPGHMSESITIPPGRQASLEIPALRNVSFLSLF